MHQTIMQADQQETRVVILKTREIKVADLPGMMVTHLKVHKAADLQETRAILLLQEQRADQVIHPHHQMAEAVVLMAAEAVVVQDHQELEEVNYKI